MAPDERPASPLRSPTLRAVEDPEVRLMPLGSAPSLPDWPADIDLEPADGELTGTITTKIVGLLRRQTGRGPTRAKTVMTPELVVITLTECLTTVERRLVGDGHGALVTHGRRAIYQGLGFEAQAVVEELTGRRVTAYLTAQEGDPDLALLMFYLAPPDRFLLERSSS